MTPSFRAVAPGDDEFAPYYQKYIGVVPPGDIVATLAEQRSQTLTLLSVVSETQAMFAYASGKWNVKEVLGHIVDTERVFSYRALCFARNDSKALPSMESDDFVRYGEHSSRRIADILTEFDHLRVSTLDMLGGFSADAWLRRGTAADNPVSVRALAWIIAGHERHHTEILRSRYLKQS
jgi:hypothetical protein